MKETNHAKIAQGLASMGRYGDSMLVHMTPGEVAGLQSLAVAQGKSLTINPKTGLPEAFILAPLVGAALGGLTGMSALGVGLTTGLLGWAITGDLGKGILAGLGGAGGAGLAGALGQAGAAQAAVPAVTSAPTVGAATATGAAGAGSFGAGLGGTSITSPGLAAGLTPSVATTGGTSLLTQAAPYVMPTAGQVASGVTNAAGAINLGNSAAAAGAPNIAEGIKYAFNNPLEFAKQYPMETFSAASPFISSALTPPKLPEYKEEESTYEGPYYPTERQASFPTAEERQQLGTKEYQYFNPVHPYPGYEPYPYAQGGSVFETADQGSDPGVDAIEARTEYGLGGLARFADGGSTAEKNYGITPVASVASTAGAVPASSTYANSYSVPSVAFQQQLDARQKQLGKLMEPTGIGGMFSVFEPMARAVGPYYYKPGLTRAQAEARLGPAPVWNPASMSNAGVAPTAVPGPMSAYQGTGITSMPTAVPRASVLGDYTSAVSNAIGMPRLAKGGYLHGPGDGMSDSIPATIEGRQPARLADGEFVVPADVVSHLGNGSTKAGAQRLYSMMDKVRKARTGTTKQGKQIKPEKYMPA